MDIQRNKDKIQITVSSRLDSFGLQRLIDYLKYLEATSASKATASQADQLADEASRSWWERNKNSG